MIQMVDSIGFLDGSSIRPALQSEGMKLKRQLYENVTPSQ